MIPFYIHDFLNSTPVTFPIEKGIMGEEITLNYFSPSEIVEKIQTTDTFSGVVPSIVLRNNALNRIDSFCISSKGKVKTVCLYSQNPLEEIKTIFLDTRSRTSHVMLKIILSLKGIANKIEYKTLDYKNGFPAEKQSAFMVIGDDNFHFHEQTSGMRNYDLGELWFELTGKKFVHAVALAKNSDTAHTLNILFQECIEYSSRHFHELIDFASQRYQLDKKICESYLKENIQYQLDKEAEEGLNHFIALANKYDL
ncbi:MAG: menaquinone biosynthesis protein [Nitrospinae bacterium]|nr:menaquinone biosynthesis protein [Nitrospinota bacterium]